MTLTETAVLTKKVMVFSVILVFVSILAWVGYRYYYYNIYLPNLPKVEIKPEVKFGQLQKPEFPKSNTSATNFSYTLDTVTGDLPADIPKIIKVYFITERSITLLDSNRAGALASSLGFPEGPQFLSPTKSKYLDGNGGEMTIDLNTGNFEYSRNIDLNSDLLEAGKLKTKEVLEGDFKQFLKQKSLLRDQLTSGKLEATFDQGRQQSSKTATISLWQDNVDDYKIITPSFDKGLISATTTSFPKESEKYINLEYTYWQIDESISSTYPIKDPKKAFDDLKNGDGAIIKSPESGKISLRSIYLGYYLPKDYTTYLQPVYVFEGEDFVAFVPAISSTYLE